MPHASCLSHFLATRRISDSALTTRHSALVSCHHHAFAHQLPDEAGEIFVREVVPAAAGVVFGLLDVAGQGGVTHFLAGELPLVGQLLELLARGGGAFADEPMVAGAQLAVSIAGEAAAE